MKAAPRILVVDDDPEIATMLTRALARHGYRIATSRSPDEVLALVAADPDYQAAFLDLVMPERDGAALADALRRLIAAGVELDGASDHGVSEALYLRDPDGNGLELYWDRPRDEWPRAADGSLRMSTERLDVRKLRAEAAARTVLAAAPQSPYAPMTDEVRSKLKDLRARLLHLHKVLLDDARVAYEMDRGRVGSPGIFLQLVINDPWFAWLHALSELIVRIDQNVEREGPATDGDGAALVEQVGRLLTASEDGEGFARRYYEALQRQPAVVLAHADVRRVLKGMKS
jgi:hypothetical protein